MSRFINVTPRDIAILASLAGGDEILTRKASESEHNCALEKSIELQRHIDNLMASATRRRNDALQQVELYRNGLGARAKEVTDRILEGEFQEVAPASVKATT